MSDNSIPLFYKNRPLVRCGDEIYYGNMTDKFIILMKILSYTKVGDVDVADKILIQMLYTDPDIKGKGKIYKTSEKDGMATALEFAGAWLDRGK